MCWDSTILFIILCAWCVAILQWIRKENSECTNLGKSATETLGMMKQVFGGQSMSRTRVFGLVGRILCAQSSWYRRKRGACSWLCFSPASLFLVLVSLSSSTGTIVALSQGYNHIAGDNPGQEGWIVRCGLTKLRSNFNTLCLLISSQDPWDKFCGYTMHTQFISQNSSRNPFPLHQQGLQWSLALFPRFAQNLMHTRCSLFGSIVKSQRTTHRVLWKVLWNLNTSTQLHETLHTHSSDMLVLPPICVKLYYNYFQDGSTSPETFGYQWYCGSEILVAMSMRLLFSVGGDGMRRFPKNFML